MSRLHHRTVAALQRKELVEAYQRHAPARREIDHLDQIVHVVEEACDYENLPPEATDAILERVLDKVLPDARTLEQIRARLEQTINLPPLTYRTTDEFLRELSER